MPLERTMDDYSQKTIQLLQVANASYLKELLNKIGIHTDELSDSKKIGKLIANQNMVSTELHKSSIFACKICGSNNVITREIQMRSSDEGSSIIHICLKCGNKW